MTNDEDTNGKGKLLPIRFSPEADELLRPPNTRRGDIARRILEAVASTNLAKVKVEKRPQTPFMGKSYAITSIKMPLEQHKLLTEAAEARDISTSVLIDGCVRSYWGKKQAKLLKKTLAGKK